MEHGGDLQARTLKFEIICYFILRCGRVEAGSALVVFSHQRQIGRTWLHAATIAIVS